jgi:signal transduction histidine kinase
VRRGLTSRAIAASLALALLVGVAFGVLVDAVDEERDSAAAATRSQQVIAAANRLERLVLDLETGQRGFLIVGEERFLEPWSAARRTYRQATAALVAAAGGVDGQGARARRIAASVDAYVRQYSVPLVEAARRGEASARGAAALAEGKRRVDEIRAEFDEFVGAERRLFTTREDEADADARRAVIVAAVGLVGSVLLILLFGGYLVRAVTLPVRRAAAMAGRLAGGDLATRMPEAGAGEIGALERSFNTMAGSLEKSRDELRMLADEQAALRRVATLVARGVPPAEIFDAAAAEVHSLLRADSTRLIRYETDGTITGVAGRAVPGFDIPEDERFELHGHTVTAAILRTGRPARIDGYDPADGPIAAEMSRRGIRSAVGAPIVVEGRLWGAFVAAWKTDHPSHDSEDRLAQFTELVATALANAQSRAELAASRARVVATADETRRRIERDLHDGAQQSLVHTLITLKLARRGLGDADGTAIEFLDQALAHAERANADLRDLAHGILPATLSRGLEAALETLVARLHLPVTVDVTPERLPPDVEATAYFIVAEALTNTVKHAGASKARVSASVRDGALHVEVNDDGVGGASMDAGTGLLGLHDRTAALNGELQLNSVPGAGTTITVILPLPES